MLKKGWVVVGGEPVTDTQEQDAPEFLDHFIEVLDQQAQALK